MKLNHVSRKGSIRFWLLGMLLAAVVMLLAAAVTLLVMAIIPEPEYTAHVWLRVAHQRPNRLSEEWKKYRDEIPALICGDLVLNAALQRPGIAELESLKNKEDKKAWLAENLKVGYLGGSEILQVAISGKNPEDLVKILLAVRAAFMDEVVAVTREEDVRQRIALEDAYKDMEKQIAAKKLEMKDLAEESAELDECRLELARMEKMYKQMGTQLDEWVIESAAGDSRYVQAINEPEVPRIKRGFRWPDK